MFSQKAYDIFFIKVGIAVFVYDFKTVFQGKFWVFVPILDFLEDIFNPIEFLVDINFGRFLIVDEGEKGFVVDHL
jgi:hypothetical protein